MLKRDEMTERKLLYSCYDVLGDADRPTRKVIDHVNMIIAEEIRGLQLCYITYVYSVSVQKNTYIYTVY